MNLNYNMYIIMLGLGCVCVSPWLHYIMLLSTKMRNYDFFLFPPWQGELVLWHITRVRSRMLDFEFFSDAFFQICFVVVYFFVANIDWYTLI